MLALALSNSIVLAEILDRGHCRAVNVDQNSAHDAGRIGKIMTHLDLQSITPIVLGQ